MPVDADALLLAGAILLLGGIKGKEEMVEGDWYLEKKDVAGTMAYIEFPLGVYECSFADLMMRTITAKGMYRSQIVVFKGSWAYRNESGPDHQHGEYFVASGYTAYGHHLVAQNFIIRGPCTLIGQVVDKLGDTFDIKLAAVLRKIG